ncbi:MAG: DUF222 domain-containing protein [Microthrixaceae bacterium]
MFDHHQLLANRPADTAATLRGLVDLAAGALERAARLDVDQVDAATLRHATLQLERLRRATDSAEAHTLHRLDHLRETDLTAGHATSRWLAHQAGLPAGIARRRLALANRLAALPAVDEALTEGTIGVDHAQVFADVVNDRNAADMAPLLPDLIQAARGTRFRRWKAHVTALASLLDQDGCHDPAADLAANRLTLSPSSDFMLVRGELAGEHALTVHDTLNAIADELFQQYSRDHATFPELQVPPRSTLLALALEEVCRRALAVDRASTRPPRVEATIIIDARADATGPGWDGSGWDGSGWDGSGWDGNDVRAIEDAWRIQDLMGSPLPAASLPTFLCDPVLYAALLDSLGLPVDMGRSVRTVTPAQRRALVLRDGGCTFPGCECPAAWTDAHHIDEWDAGDGPTDLDNLLLLCRRHHRVAHRAGWQVTLDIDGWSIWRTPSGASTFGQRHHRQRAGP